MKTIWSRVTLAFLAVGSLAVSYGCSPGARAQDGRFMPAETLAGGPGGIVVACEPHQRAVVRQVFLNGQAVSQVECATAAPAGYVAYDRGTSMMQVPYATPVSDIRVVPAVQYAPPPERRIVTERRVASPPVQTRRTSGRTWQKSAVIIGSSAGIGAGVGAAVGGKKGALVGAAIGGGSAAIWDQATRDRGR